MMTSHNRLKTGLNRILENHALSLLSIYTLQVQKYCTTVLSAMMAGMDDKEDMDDDITLEAMSGLSRILMKIDEANIRPILVNIALRIRPCFEKVKGGLAGRWYGLCS